MTEAFSSSFEKKTIFENAPLCLHAATFQKDVPFAGTPRKWGNLGVCFADVLFKRTVYAIKKRLQWPT